VRSHRRHQRHLQRRHFQTIDLIPDPPVENIWGQAYAISEASFLAGYAAAAATTTQKVGTFGAMNFPAIAEFMDGYAFGVKEYDTAHSANVQVLGWDVVARTGTFTDSFVDQAKGKQVTNDLLAQGADVIFPVAGGSGFGAADAVIVNGNAYVIGVDADWAVHAAYAPVCLTSVLKHVDVSVVKAATAVRDGTFQGGAHMGNLDNGEVDIAPFHSLEAKIPAGVKDEIAALRASIIAGSTKTKPLSASPC
jgi:basic membrane protein A and related proteins